MKRIPFDATFLLRALACFIIIWYHCSPPTQWLILKGINLSFITYPSPTAAVFIFYLLSGYAIGYGFASRRYTKSFPSLISYYVNRILRIVPAYYVNILLCITVFYPHKATPYDLIRFFTFTANYDHGSLPFQALLAIISTEVQFYVIAPFLFGMLHLLLRYLSVVWVGVLSLCAGIFARYAFVLLGIVHTGGGWTEIIYLTVWGNIDFFLFGMFVSYVVCRRVDVIDRLKRYVRPTLFYSVLIGWILWVNLTSFPGFQMSWQYSMLRLLFLLPTSLCLLIGWFIASHVVRKPTFRIGQTHPYQMVTLLVNPKTSLYTIGMVSYGLFLYHYIVVDRIFGNRMGQTWWGFAVELFVVLAVSLLAAMLSYSLVEYPIMYLKKYHSAPRTT